MKISNSHTASGGGLSNLHDNYATAREAAQATGLSLASVYRHLPRVKLHGKVLIPVEAVRQIRHRLAEGVRDVA